jgi:hypothetical protein
MQTAANPRHPWRAIAVVLLVFAVVHGTRAHAFFGDHEHSRIHVVQADRDCGGVHIDVNDDADADDPDEDAVFDVFDDDDWS